MIPEETPYKVIKYLVNLFDKKVLRKNYEKEKLIIFLLERKFICEPDNNNKFAKTKKFDDYYYEEIYLEFQKYDMFIQQHKIEFVEAQCSIQELENLILIDEEKPNNTNLQEILSNYFKSSKYTQLNSNLAKAIKTILNIDEFAEESKDQQFISILYPKSKTRFIILCENKNRLRGLRHPFIEFWYAGGRNTIQLQFIPKPASPIYYLFDWDFDGLNIFNHIKQKYFPTLLAFIPINYETLMEEQDKVKHHHSKWENDNSLRYLNEKEKIIVAALIKTNCIIEEQKIPLSNENLVNNAII